MHYIFEAIIIGVYTIIVYLLLSIFINNIYFLFILVGFFKHFFGYLLQIHNYYCNYGYACNNTNNSKHIVNTTFFQIFLESIIEGIIFIFIGILLLLFIKNKIIIFFLIGFSLHIIYELLGIHKIFCKYKCKKLIL
jgi:hypothetical protein